MKPIILITLTSLLTYSSISSAAHPHRESCIKERWTLIKTENAYGCKSILPVELKEKMMTYPLMNIGPVKVRYWQGKFEKQTLTTKTYKHSYINVCNGETTYHEIEKEDSLSSEFFEVPNPNLSEEITETFKLAPMTSEEAHDVAYAGLKKLCSFLADKDYYN
jgi:hypothetical protein